MCLIAVLLNAEEDIYTIIFALKYDPGFVFIKIIVVN